MYKDSTYKQWVQDNWTNPNNFRKGELLVEELLHEGESEIPAGTLLVFEWQGRPYLIFQTLLNIVLTTSANSTLVAYEPGSIVFTKRESTKDCFVPTIRLRDCRVPTIKEINRYHIESTV